LTKQRPSWLLVQKRADLEKYRFSYVYVKFLWRLSGVIYLIFTCTLTVQYHQRVLCTVIYSYRKLESAQPNTFQKQDSCWQP